MPRQARLDVPGALHHIMVRGIDKTNIFRDDEDKARFLERLGRTVTEGKCTVYAWVLMDNHVHILFKSGKAGISTVMRKLLTWYALHFNRRHRRTGHLFENRYKSILCDEDNYLLALIRYIHLNPLRAGMVKTIEELDLYPWSGHSAVMNKRECPWMAIDYVLLQFNETTRRARNAYRRFAQEGIGMGRQPQLTGGGLVRSLGGWSQVQSAQRKGRKTEYDERILGSGDFVTAIFKEAEEKQIRQLKLHRSGRTIADIIREECKQSKVSEEELTSGNKRCKVSEARMTIARRSRNELGLSGAEIARHLGVNTSSINRALARVAEVAGTGKR
jgi:REP element-mobilizing transposase RayT